MSEQQKPAGARIIAGSGRSGTTWLLDALADANDLRPVFEPLHPVAVPEAHSLAGRCLRAGDESAEAEVFFRRVLGGDLHNVWVDYRLRPDRLRLTPTNLHSWRAARDLYRRWRKLGRNYRRFRTAVRRDAPLVKLIRGNLMLGWLREHFATRSILVLRHPAAVVESRLRLGGPDWDPVPELARYRADPALTEMLAIRYDAWLDRELKPAEAHTLIWCIENQLPIERRFSGPIPVVFYEELLAAEPGAWQEVATALELAHLPDEAALRKPSEQASELSRADIGGTRRASWRERLDPEQLMQIDTVLRSADVQLYDAYDPMPRSAELARARGR